MINGKIILIILDGCGAGALPDAEKYNDTGANTIKHVIDKTGIDLPNLNNLGLYKIISPATSQPPATGYYGKMAEASAGKDTTTGHWEITGLKIEKQFPLYPQGFPEEVINKFKKITGKDVIGNKPASGTEIIKELGEEHLKTGKLIVYTSADSVFQVAAHIDIISLEELYEVCRKARQVLDGDYEVLRVIARPFTGEKQDFKRLNDKRKDFGLKPPDKTLLDYLIENNISVDAVGKINEIFSGQGISVEYKTANNFEGIERTIELIKTKKKDFIFTNLVDFDMVWGHRNDYQGYAKGLKAFDSRLPEIMASLNNEDILIITSDHGCDPTTKGTDHTREYVPLLVYGKKIKQGVNLGTRQTFADVGQTIAEYYRIGPLNHGRSFLPEIWMK